MEMRTLIQRHSRSQIMEASSSMFSCLNFDQATNDQPSCRSTLQSLQNKAVL